MSASKFAVNIAGMPWQTPLCLASGNAGFGFELASIQGFPFDALGAITLKGTTLAPKAGNPMDRVWETPSGLINSIGLENPGVEHVVEQLLPSAEKTLAPSLNLIANVCGSTIEEYAQVTACFNQTNVSAIEVNISCPNVKEGGAAFGNDPVQSAEVIQACRAQTTKPLIAKLSPNQTDIAKSAEVCIQAGADALSAINTLSAMLIDINQRKPILGGVRGGLSGSAIRPIALLKVHEVYQVAKQHNIPIIAQGGISRAEHVIEFFLAGASACAIGTALALDTQQPKRILKDLNRWLNQQGVTHLSELTGQLTV